MGYYDRDYQQQPTGGYVLRRPSSMVVTLILINVAFYLANGLLTGPTNRLTELMSVHLGTLTRPWFWWQYVSYGFAHAPLPTIQHILFNMLGLFFLGRDVEDRYGSKEFLRMYLLFIVVGGVVWNVVELIWAAQAVGGLAAVLQEVGSPLGPRRGPICMGASGGVVGIVVVYAMNFPHRTLLLWGVLPMPAWVLGVLIVVMDLFGAANPGTNIAHGVHLTGAAVAFLYVRNRWNLGRFGQRISEMTQRRKRLRLHEPDRAEKGRAEGNDPHDAAVDAVLEKITEKGLESLTPKERRILQDASRRYPKKHDPL